MTAQAPRLIGAYDLTFARGWRAPWHVHAGVEELLVLTAGEVELTAGRSHHAAGAGSVVIYPRGRDHVEWNAGATPVRMLCLLWEHGARAEIGRLPPLSFDARGRVRCAASWICELAAGRRGATEGRAAAVAGLLGALVDECLRPAGAEEDERITRARCHVERHFAEPLTLDDLARVAAMSRYHFAHRFRAATGESPLAYLRRVRVERACELLASTGWTQARIAAEVGFADEFQMSRVVRRATGRAPGGVRGR